MTRFNRVAFCTMIAAGLLFIGTSYNGCDSDFQAVKDAADQSSTGTPGTPGPTPPPPPNTPPATPSVNLTTDVTALTTELADQKTVRLTVTSTNGFSGPVDLRASSPEIDALDPRDGVKITVEPANLTLTAGGSAQATITVSVDTTSPSAQQHFHLLALQGGTEMQLKEAEVNLTIQPIFRIRVKGVGDANWFIGPTSQTFATRGVRTLSFIPHAAGLQVMFENYDAVGRIIHSGNNNTIRHGDVNNPLAPSPDGGITVGGTYKPLLIPAGTRNTGVYLHNGENNGASRTLNFNVQ